jgi:hypothetical protein
MASKKPTREHPERPIIEMPLLAKLQWLEEPMSA